MESISQISGRDRDRYSWKLMALAVVIALLAGAIGALLSAQFFMKPGPAGPEGSEGPEGPQGEQGPMGIPGIDGIDSILQVVQKRNDTSASFDGYPVMEWHNISDFDSSMEIIFSIQQDSKIFVQFSTSHRLEPPATISIRIVVDGVYNSSKYVSSTGPPASGVYMIPGHMEFLTDSLDAGSHVINVQFMREVGSPTILERTLTAMEISS